MLSLGETTNTIIIEAPAGLPASQLHHILQSTASTHTFSASGSKF